MVLIDAANHTIRTIMTGTPHTWPTTELAKPRMFRGNLFAD